MLRSARCRDLRSPCVLRNTKQAVKKWKIGWENARDNANHLWRITTKSEAQNTYKIYRSITNRPEICSASATMNRSLLTKSVSSRFRPEGSPEYSCRSGAVGVSSISNRRSCQLRERSGWRLYLIPQRVCANAKRFARMGA